MNDGTNLAVEVSQPLAEARVFRVATQDQYLAAGERLKGIKSLLKKVGDTFDPIISKAHAAHKEAVQQKKTHETPLIQAEGIYKLAMLQYTSNQERIQREQQAKLDEQARKEREKLEEQARKAAEKGKVERAAELQSRAETVAAPVVSVSTPTVSGISTRETYKAVVTDKMALIRAVAEGKVPDAVLNYDQAVMNSQARSLKTALNYPGVKVEIVKTLSSTAS